jgi:hypothetical protein
MPAPKKKLIKACGNPKARMMIKYQLKTIWNKEWPPFPQRSSCTQASIIYFLSMAKETGTLIFSFERLT